MGGGGLVGGIASYLKSVWPSIKVIGCSPVNSAVMIHSIQKGKILNLESKPTLSDGTAGWDRGNIQLHFQYVKILLMKPF